MTLFNGSVTLLGCQLEWPKDKLFLLMHSRHARNLYDPKIKIIFEIAWTLFEIILFIHLNKHLDGAKITLWKKLKWTIVYHFKWIHLAQFFFDFHARVKKCHISLSEKLPKWHFLTHAWKSKKIWAKCIHLKK